MEDTLNHIDRSVEILMWDRSEALMAKGGTRDLQLIQLAFLNAFDAFCKEHKGASINSESQFFHFADSTQNNAESLSTDPMLRLFCRGSC